MRGLHYGDYDYGYDCESLHLAGYLEFFKEFTFFFFFFEGQTPETPRWEVVTVSWIVWFI